MTVIVVSVCATLVALGAIAAFVVSAWRGGACVQHMATCMYRMARDAGKTARHATDAAVTPEHAQADRVLGPRPSAPVAPRVDAIDQYEGAVFGHRGFTFEPEDGDL